MAENYVSRKDIAEMAKSGMAAIMKEAKDPQLLTNFLQTSAHNLNLSPSNKMALAVQAPGRAVMTYDGIKYQGGNSVRKGEKAAAFVVAPKKNDEGKVYFAPVPVFSADQLKNPVQAPAAQDLARAVGAEPDKISAPLTAALNEIAGAAGERPYIGDLDAGLPAQTAALILEYRHDAADPALEAQVRSGLMKPDRGMPTGEFVRSCKNRQEALSAGDNLAVLGNAVISKTLELQKENPEFTLKEAMTTPGKNGRSQLHDLASQVVSEKKGAPPRPQARNRPQQKKSQQKSQKQQAER